MSYILVIFTLKIKDMEYLQLSQLLFTIQAIVFVFALAYSASAVRDIGTYIGMVSSKQTVTMSGSVIYLPAILWGVFYFLVSSQDNLILLILNNYE